jgi:Rrf2 family protein
MLSVSTKTEYGLRALIRIAKASDELSIAEIASLEGISPKYLEGIASLLKSAGLILSQRGKHGGYRLARGAELISLREVIRALEGDVTPVRCAHGAAACGHSPSCASKRFWEGLKKVVDDYLEDTSLADLAGEGAKAGSPRERRAGAKEA